MENSKIQIFEYEGINVDVVEINGEPFFEIYSTGMALGYTTCAKGKVYSYKSRIDTIIKNADIRPVSHGVKLYFAEDQLYDFMMEARTEKCRPFRKWVVSEVLPTIRKTGGYVNDDELFIKHYLPDADERTLILFKAAFNSIKNMGATIAEQKETIEEQKPKARYYDMILQSPNTVAVSLIAKDYGLSAKRFNKVLNGLGVQYRVNGAWVLYAEHQGNGYTVSKTYLLNNGNSHMSTYWTQKGRLWLYELLKAKGVLPEAEKKVA